jgi:hypothetical protein
MRITLILTIFGRFGGGFLTTIKKVVGMRDMTGPLCIVIVFLLDLQGHVGASRVYSCHRWYDRPVHGSGGILEL